MKIASVHDLPSPADAGLHPSRGGTVTHPATAVGGAAAGHAPAGDRVELSAAGAQLGRLEHGDFDAAKVEAIRQALREGRFTVHPEAIADRLIADAAALLAPRGS